MLNVRGKAVYIVAKGHGLREKLVFRSAPLRDRQLIIL